MQSKQLLGMNCKPRECTYQQTIGASVFLTCIQGQCIRGSCSYASSVRQWPNCKSGVKGWLTNHSEKDEVQDVVLKGGNMLTTSNHRPTLVRSARMLGYVTSQTFLQVQAGLMQAGLAWLGCCRWLPCQSNSGPAGRITPPGSNVQEVCFAFSAQCSVL